MNAVQKNDLAHLVRSNLHTLEALIAQLFPRCAQKTANAYQLFRDARVHGLTVYTLQHLLSTAFSELSEEHPAAAILMADLASAWYTIAPADPGDHVADDAVQLRIFSANLHLQLASCAEHVANDLEQEFSYNDQHITLSDLAYHRLPAEGSNEFMLLTNRLLLAFDRALWRHLLQEHAMIAVWETPEPLVHGRDKNQPPTGWAQSFYNDNPDYYINWRWEDHNNTSGWHINAQSICRRAGLLAGQPLPPDVCRYLFTDSTPGTIIQPEGLFTRAEVFTEMEITTMVRLSGSSAV